MASRRSNKALTSPEALRKQLAERRQSQDSIVGSGTGNFISTKGMRLTYRGNTLETPLAVLVLAWAQDFAYFDSPYKEDDIKPPACAALARKSINDLTPLKDAPAIQSKLCGDCPMNEFGSDPMGGRGKACANRYRVAILPANDTNHDIAMVRVSPSGYAGFETFINRVEQKGAGPVTTWIHAMDFQPGSDYPVLEFHEQHVIDDGEVLAAVLARVDEAEALVEQHTYDFTQYTPPRAARGRKKAARR